MSRGDEDREAVLATAIASEQDGFALRHQSRTAARLSGLENLDQVRLATTLSELGRDLLRAVPISADFIVSEQEQEPARLIVELRWPDDRTPSVEALDALGRLLQHVACQPDEDPGRVVLELPIAQAAAVRSGRADEVRQALPAGIVSTPEENPRAQTRDLIAALEDSRARGEELHRINLELTETNTGMVALYSELSREREETNSGVVALYAELEEKTLLLREAGESKTRLWSNVSHELRTPLNSVIGLSRLLLDPGSEPLSAEQRRRITMVSAAGGTLLALVDELLDVAKAEAGRMRPRSAAVDLRALLAQLKDVMYGTATGDDVVLVIPEPEAPPVPVTDEAMLIRILRNLLSNGLKFTRSGEVRLDIEQESERWLLFKVSDTGVGIPEDQLADVFEEFYQVAGPHQRGRPGTGLGLPYARRLAEVLGGTLTLESIVGRGTCVTLRLPTRPEIEASPGRVSLLLTIDDDLGFHDLCRPELAQLADRVIEVADSGGAIEAIARERPDAILVDLNMPDPDGYAVVERLAADPGLRDIPVIVVTAADPGLVDTGRLRHARAVLSKTGLTAATVAGALFNGAGADSERGGAR